MAAVPTRTSRLVLMVHSDPSKAPRQKTGFGLPQAPQDTASPVSLKQGLAAMKRRQARLPPPTKAAAALTSCRKKGRDHAAVPSGSRRGAPPASAPPRRPPLSLATVNAKPWAARSGLNFYVDIPARLPEARRTAEPGV